MMKEENCPCCPNHCPKDNLSCGRGMSHFSDEATESTPLSIDKQIIDDLRKCGHLLHHNKDLNVDEILAGFTEEELNKLHELLSKFYNNIQ